jgi:membrane dipeptidase
MDITQGPIVASHSNSRTVWDVSRNITDDMFLAICRTGGIVGLNQYTDFIGENADILSACRHILHFLELDPHGTHIALGADLDGCETLPVGIAGIQDYPKIAQALSKLGVSDEIIMNIFWRNAIGVMKKCCM